MMKKPRMVKRHSRIVLMRKKNLMGSFFQPVGCGCVSVKSVGQFRDKNGQNPA